MNMGTTKTSPKPNKMGIKRGKHVKKLRKNAITKNAVPAVVIEKDQTLTNKKGKRKPKIPTSMTDLKIRILVDAIKYDCSEREATMKARVPRTTYQQWKTSNYIIAYQFTDINENGEPITYTDEIGFRDLIEFTKTQMGYAARKALYYNIVKNQSVRASVEFLKRRDKRYNDKIDTDHSGIIVQFGMGKSQFIKAPDQDDNNKGPNPNLRRGGKGK